MSEKVSTLEKHIDDQDAYERRDTVILTGECVPAAVEGEICSNVISDIVKEKLKLILPQTEISVAHRLG